MWSHEYLVGGNTCIKPQIYGWRGKAKEEMRMPKWINKISRIPSEKHWDHLNRWMEKEPPRFECELLKD